ncbi:HD domain-containing protein [Lacrimispora defluvii]|uniref:5'-deoxynucleotidase n=1 Tax=Lacrimispora defluvii TaxID=2719233 RepID=A0ABX1VNB5_9FIRM|nr:HD domain-containing protein [Lacrimispora defluvii]NNJ29254.1 HD domain-containing protein [Lacrimispora defluvii]
MNPEQLIEFLGILENLKCNTRHNWTTNGRQESVAEHSWRLAVLAMLMEDDFPELDMNKVIRMCLIHDWGEAVTGDIPAFIKTEADEEKESDAIETLLKNLPETISSGFLTMFKEMSDLTSDEAILVKALDKTETLIQHNEAGSGTWLPLEYDLNLTYGNEVCGHFEKTRQLRDKVREHTLRIINEERREHRE